MKTNDLNDCCYCLKFFVVNQGWNSEYCSKECRDQAMNEGEKSDDKCTI